MRLAIKISERWRVVLFWTAAVAFAIWIWWWASWNFALEHQICGEGEAKNDCATYNMIFYSAWRLAKATDHWSALIAAIATGFIAWFTWTLRQSTEKMWGETKKAAEAVTIVERAYVYPTVVGHGAIEECITNALVFYLDDFTKDDVPAPETTEITFRFKNFGKTPAILKEAFVAFGVPPHGALIGVSLPESVLASLEETSPLTSRMPVGITREQARRILVYTGHVCFEGNVTFDDIWGNEHTTEFYFVWDMEIRRMALRGVRTKTKEKGAQPKTDE